jgi:hypothetical protein
MAYVKVTVSAYSSDIILMQESSFHLAKGRRSAFTAPDLVGAGLCGNGIWSLIQNYIKAKLRILHSKLFQLLFQDQLFPIKETKQCCIIDCFSIYIWRLKTFQLSFNLVRWGETESTWYAGHHLAYCTSPGW